jgi:hypothetical protein
MRLLREGRSQGETVVELMIAIQPKKRVRRRIARRPATRRLIRPKQPVFNLPYLYPLPDVYLYGKKRAAFILHAAAGSP